VVEPVLSGVRWRWRSRRGRLVLALPTATVLIFLLPVGVAFRTRRNEPLGFGNSFRPRPLESALDRNRGRRMVIWVPAVPGGAAKIEVKSCPTVYLVIWVRFGKRIVRMTRWLAALFFCPSPER